MQKNSRPNLFRVIDFSNVIKFICPFIITLGIIHMRFSFINYSQIINPGYFALGPIIIFSGIINFVLIRERAPKLYFIAGFLLNALIFILVCYELAVVNQVQTYVLIFFFLITTILFSILISKT